MTVHSDAMRFVYIETPKTASTSLSAALMTAIGTGLAQRPLGYNLATSDEMRIQIEGAGMRWFDYWSFGFVRNPWDWAVSAFMQDRRTPKYTDFGARPDNFKSWIEGLRHTPSSWVRQVTDVFMYEDLSKAVAVISDRLGVDLNVNIMNVTPHSEECPEITNEIDEVIRRRFSSEIALYGYERK